MSNAFPLVAGLLAATVGIAALGVSGWIVWTWRRND
jgi:hypothetical protein